MAVFTQYAKNSLESANIKISEITLLKDFAMHELAIIQDLLLVCEKNAQENNATKILKIELKVGRLSGVEAHYLQRAFEGFKSEALFSQAELIIEIEDVQIRCNQCGFEGVLLQNHFLCPQCHSQNLHTTAGEELYLMLLEMS
ncbi:hydrogenase maturation nickel metallochaperone HypA [Helicobacter himalayensis]|uniref:hydrogenase maturation nickel metallochaperone HypA/HybF n=1 Tax=Helicobacter himalayensis TaxID=1591088 RepID=UPI003D6E011E